MPSFGVLESSHLEHVPGTVLLEPDDPEIEVFTTNFKRSEGKFAHVILVPQPSSDPNDPLTFSSSKKSAILITCCFGAILFAATTGPLLNAALELLVIEFDVSFTLVTQYVTGYQLLVVGITGPIVSACSRKWGRRPIFLFSSLFGLIGAIIGLNYIIDQWFISRENRARILHERRGLVASIVQFFIGTITNLSTMIAGVIATHLNWRYCFYFMAMCSGIRLIALFFLVPETSFHRTTGTEANQMDYDTGPKGSGTEMIEDVSAARTMTNIPDTFPPKKTYLEGLNVFNGSHLDEPFFRLLIAPIACCLNIAVMWVILLGGGFVAFCIAPLYMMSQLFSAPPYGLTAEGVGFLNTGPLIGGILATLLLSVVNDPIIGNEVFILSMMFKNFLLFGMSYFINNVVSEKGPQYTFLWFGGAALVMMITVPFVYVLGNVYRSYWHRHNILEMWGIMTNAEL
ncbi:MFS general substrate transporter [Penicillium malachiteum]|uniref:MFS general substrate transporter n=1 Tax=Penicillium malachiteum TaxID=1324776 RepID=A0AAD6HAY6_9EURO|nr:MFS general substrate transporter [Penicillium malachiteum]